MLNRILENFKKSSVRSKIYAAIVALVFILTALFFVRSLVFIAKMVNLAKEGSVESASGGLKFNFSGFSSLAGRFNIPVDFSSPSVPPPSVIAPLQNLPPASSSAEVAPLDLSVVKASILNATGKPGLAKLWQEKFFAAGFKEISTGNYLAESVSGVHVEYLPSAKNVLPKAKEILTANGIDLASIIEKESTEQNFDLIIILGK